MPLYQSQAFVLRTYKLGESDQIVVFFTHDFGKLRAVARRSHSRSRRLAGYCQPLCLLNVILFGKPSQNLFRINSLDMVCAFQAIQEDFTYLRSALYLTELLDVATQECEPVPELFALMHWSLRQLTLVACPAMLLRIFELRLLMIMGYTPQLIYCASCMRDMPQLDGQFSPSLGGLLCTTCRTPNHATIAVSRDSLALLLHLIDHDAESVLNRPFNVQIKEELQNLLHAHLLARLGRELKSYAFLSL